MCNKNNSNEERDGHFKKLNTHLKQLQFLNQLEAHLMNNDESSIKIIKELEQIKQITQVNTLDSLIKIKKKS